MYRGGDEPVCDLREAGVRLAPGCDNRSGFDVQNQFQAMKMFCLIAAVRDPELGPLFLPCDREAGFARKPFRGRLDRMAVAEDGLHDVGRREAEPQDRGEV